MEDIMNMDSLVLIVLFMLVFIMMMTLILCFVPKDRIPLIAGFLEKVLPSIPFTGMIQAWRKPTKKNGNDLSSE